MASAYLLFLLEFERTDGLPTFLQITDTWEKSVRRK